jgi:flavin reductase (DIM6/NTAB) family NADH-FMN oxidoreductase RutF
VPGPEESDVDEEGQRGTGPDPEDVFSDIVGRLDFPMVVVTVATPDERSACLVGFSTQASIDPPRYLVGLSVANHTMSVAPHATHLGVHLLPADRMDLARLFGSTTGDEIDKFSRCRWETGPAGVPILVDAVAWFVGRIEARIDLGDHVGHLLAPVAAATVTDRPYLRYQQVKDLDPGHDA